MPLNTSVSISQLYLSTQNCKSKDVIIIINVDLIKFLIACLSIELENFKLMRNGSWLGVIMDVRIILGLIGTGGH